MYKWDQAANGWQPVEGTPDYNDPDEAYTMYLNRSTADLRRQYGGDIARAESLSGVSIDDYKERRQSFRRAMMHSDDQLDDEQLALAIKKSLEIMKEDNEEKKANASASATATTIDEFNDFVTHTATKDYPLQLTFKSPSSAVAYMIDFLREQNYYVFKKHN